MHKDAGGCTSVSLLPKRREKCQRSHAQQHSPAGMCQRYETAGMIADLGYRHERGHQGFKFRSSGHQFPMTLDDPLYICANYIICSASTGEMIMAATSTDPMAMLEALLSRVTRLEDEQAILDTLHRYNRAVDVGDDAAWAELFTEDGIFRCLDRAGAEILRIQGREALAKWVRGFRAN
jgi:hypothetical protein